MIKISLLEYVGLRLRGEPVPPLLLSPMRVGTGLGPLGRDTKVPHVTHLSHLPCPPWKPQPVGTQPCTYSHCHASSSWAPTGRGQTLVNETGMGLAFEDLGLCPVTVLAQNPRTKAARARGDLPADQV